MFACVCVIEELNHNAFTFNFPLFQQAVASVRGDEKRGEGFTLIKHITPMDSYHCLLLLFCLVLLLILGLLMDALSSASSFSFTFLFLGIFTLQHQAWACAVLWANRSLFVFSLLWLSGGGPPDGVYFIFIS